MNKLTNFSFFLQSINLTLVFLIIIIGVHYWIQFIISRRALAREGDYEMMSVRVCVCACVS